MIKFSYKVSIIIPVFNAEDFIIEDTIKSIENQSMNFEDIEVILVNDCSTDDTENILNEYAMEHENIVPIHLRENTGDPAQPRNIGMMYASADYIMFLDQDDKFKPEACESLYNKIIHENVDLVCGNHIMVAENSTYVAFEYEWMDENEIKIDNIYENPKFLTMSYAIWSKIYRKEFILENNIKFTSGVGEDLFFLLRSFLLANGIILIKDLFIVDYNLRNDSLSHQIDSNYVIEFTNFYLDFFDYCDDNLSDDLYEILFNGRMNHYFSILIFPDLFFEELSEVFIFVQKLFLKLSKHNFIFDNFMYQIFFYSIINDDIPFEDSILVYNLLKTKFNRNFNSLNKYVEQECILYIDCGNGFNEEDCLKQKYIVADENKVLFDLTNFENICNIRFDPISGVFISCNIIEIKSNFGNLKILPSNSIDSRDNNDMFVTTDSQYMIFGDFDEIEYIEIIFSCSILNNNLISQSILNM